MPVGLIGSVFIFVMELNELTLISPSAEVRKEELKVSLLRLQGGLRGSGTSAWQ